MLRNRTLRGGLISFLFQYLLQAGLFFVVPLFLSVALGLSAVATGVRLLPLSITLLLAAVGVPKVFPNASPRRVVQIGFLALFAGIVVMLALLDVGAGPEIVTWPMLLAGLGVGALASQLGSVTVSAVPDEQSGEVGGVQNTVTNLGASIGTALAGAVLISALTTSFLDRHHAQPRRPREPRRPRHRWNWPGGSRSCPTRTCKPSSTRPACPPKTADAIVDGKRQRPHRRAALVAVAARHRGTDRTLRHPPHPRSAARCQPGERGHGLTAGRASTRLSPRRHGGCTAAGWPDPGRRSGSGWPNPGRQSGGRRGRRHRRPRAHLDAGIVCGLDYSSGRSTV